MELADGGELFDYIVSKGVIPELETVYLVTQVIIFAVVIDDKLIDKLIEKLIS